MYPRILASQFILNDFVQKRIFNLPCAIFHRLKNFSLRLIHLLIQLPLKQRRTNRQKNQILLAGIRNALGRVGGDAQQVARAHCANDFTRNFYVALAGEDEENLFRAADDMQHGGDARLHPRAGDGKAGAIGGVEQFSDVAALLKEEFRGLIKGYYG